MKTRRWLAGVGAGSLLLIGGVVAGPVATFAQGHTAAPVTQSSATSSDTADATQDPAYTGSISIADSAPDTGLQPSEVDESAALQSQATITVDQARQAALAANPGTTVTKAELGNENGSLVYDVELSNGMDVKVDAGNGQILATDTADANEAPEAGTSDTAADTDTVQDQSGDQSVTDAGGAEQPETAPTAP